MKSGLLFTGTVAAALFLAWTAEGQPPGGEKGKEGGKGGFPGKGGFQKGGPGGFGGGMRGAPGQIMPQFIQEQLKLTDEQKKQVEDLQKDVDGKMDKILTAEQKDQLKQMRERGPGGPGGRGPGGAPGGPGGKGGEKGEKKGPPPADME
jgi:hypothetical protein